MNTPSAICHQLLDEPLLSVDVSGRNEKVTLPGLLARLSRGEPTEMARLQAHQQHAWHAFVVQLAAIALTRAQTFDIPHDEGAWRSMLVDAARLDGGGEEAFALVVSDLTRPAFMQSPIPGGTLADLKSEHATPSEELDVLITSKNHDVKVDRLAEPTPELWAYALVTLQTMQGFLGAGNYGIARMNGGFSSRPCVAYAPHQGAAARFVRDVGVLLDAREALLKLVSTRANSPTALIWCVPWDGTKSLQLNQLDPYFIEICRRLRLRQGADGSIIAHRASSKVARIDGKESFGHTGDAWTPVDHEKGTSLTMPETGFTYARVQDLLFSDDWVQGVAGVLYREDGDRPWFVGQVLVRGQGKTGGFHERWLPIAPKAALRLRSTEGRSLVAKRAKAWVDKASQMEHKVLKPAVLALLQGGPEKLKFDDPRAGPWVAELDRAVDEAFFPELFAQVDASPEEADASWDRWLVENGRRTLERAFDSAPLPLARRHRAVAHASAVFFGAARKHFPTALPTAATETTSPDGGSP